MALAPAVLAELENVVGAAHVRSTPGDVAPSARDATRLFSGCASVRAVAGGPRCPRTSRPRSRRT